MFEPVLAPAASLQHSFPQDRAQPGLTGFPFRTIESMYSRGAQFRWPRKISELFMSASPTLHSNGPGNRDVFDSLESCEKLLTAREVARILSISEKTVYSYVSRNLIPHYKIEANVRFRAREVADWLRNHGPVVPGPPAADSKRAGLRR